MDRLEGMRQCRLGNGETECILCGETFRFYHRSQKRCAECGKMTCSKCGMESTVLLPHHEQNRNGGRKASGSSMSTLSSSTSVTSLLSATLGGGSSNGNEGKETVWLCKICGEQREMWKKSGAWFFKVDYYYTLFLSFKVGNECMIPSFFSGDVVLGVFTCA